MVGTERRDDHVPPGVIRIAAIPLDADLGDEFEAVQLAKSGDGARRAGAIGLIGAAHTARGFQDAADESSAPIGVGVVAPLVDGATLVADPSVDPPLACGPSRMTASLLI